SVDLHADVPGTVRVVNRANAIQRLNDNSEDRGSRGMGPGDKPLASLPGLGNELVGVVRAGHPLLLLEQTALPTIRQAVLLTRETGSGSRLALELHCQQQRLDLKAIMQLGSNDAVKHAVLAGLGVAVLPKLSILPELQLGSLQTLALPGFPLRRSWCVVYPQGKHPTPAMRAFLDYVQQNIRQFEQMFSLPPVTE